MTSREKARALTERVDIDVDVLDTSRGILLILCCPRRFEATKYNFRLLISLSQFPIHLHEEVAILLSVATWELPF